MTRHLLVSLVFATGCSLLPSGHSSSEQSTAPTDPNGPHAYGRAFADKTCTINGTLDARCMEVAGYPSVKAAAYARSDGEQQALMDCFAEVSEIARKEQDPSATARISALYTQYISTQPPKLADDPGAAACIVAANGALGDHALYDMYWRHDGVNQAHAVIDGFKNVCKTEARPGHFPTVTLVDVAQAKIMGDARVAFASSRPTYEYLCSGVLRWKDNGNLIVTNAAFTTTKELKAACMTSCRHDPASTGEDKIRWVCDDTPDAKSCIAACTKKCETYY